MCQRYPELGPTAERPEEIRALLNDREQDKLRYIIDNMGLLSAQAQHLRVPITDYNRLRAGTHSLYLCTTGIPGKPDFILVKGMLKVGVKNLYIRKDNGELVEMAPLCVLDFYVHEKHQRLGLGHELFEAMCQREKKRPHQLGIDRPSAKLHSFLEKYYNLTEFLPQANQFVVFKDYFGEQQRHADDSEYTSSSGWSQEKQESASLLENSKRNKVLHGRRAKKSETTDTDLFPLKLPTEQDVDRSDLANKCPSHHQPQGRRQSRQQLANNSNSDKVLHASTSAETQWHQLNSPLPSEREAVKARSIVVGQQLYPSSRDSKLGQGRRSLLPKDGSAEPKKMNDKSCMRYSSPPSLPRPLEKPQEESMYNPAKLPRRETTRARLFHEDQLEPQNSPIPPTPLKYPYWTEDPQIFDSKSYYRTSKIEIAPIATFQMTRSCYHAGMQGCGAAEAMGYHNRVVR